MKKKVLVIVAHPDDETIWMGGTLIRNRNNWDTTIISMCRKNDKNRAPKFKKVCEVLKAKCFISDLEDEKLSPIPLHEIIKRIISFLKKTKSYDYIFTHGFNGEYGHLRHREIHQAVKFLVDKKFLWCKKLFFFSYINKQKFCLPSKNSDKFIKLNQFELLEKKKLIMKIYGFKEKSFETLSCREIEAFKEKRCRGI